MTLEQTNEVGKFFFNEPFNLCLNTPIRHWMTKYKYQ